MLLLMFRSAEALYAIDARRVVEVVPLVELRPIPHAPADLMGLLSYRGRVVPVVDLAVLLGSGPSREALSTRVILTEFRTPLQGHLYLGLVAENVSHVRQVEPGHVAIPSMNLDEAPYLGPVLQLDEGLVQLVSVEKVLSERVREALYGSLPEAP